MSEADDEPMEKPGEEWLIFESTTKGEKKKMSEKPISCPFCGDNALHTEPNEAIDGSSEFAVRCENCGAYGPWWDNRKGAIAAWNRRAK
jgi:Lar family restriction alleviation protein